MFIVRIRPSSMGRIIVAGVLVACFITTLALIAAAIVTAVEPGGGCWYLVGAAACLLMASVVSAGMLRAMGRTARPRWR